MSKFVIIGVEYNDLWNNTELYIGENKHGGLVTTPDFDKALQFETIESAEEKRISVQKEWYDWGWYVLKLND